MGTDTDQEEFGEGDYARFAQRLEECLTVLGQLLNQPGFGAGPTTIGAELELVLIDDAGRTLPHNQAIRAAVADPRVTLELNRCNLELNASPALLAGQPFTALGGEFNLLVDRVAHAARDHGGRVALIGILPTLKLADLAPVVMTDVPRYRALDRGLRRLRQDPFRLRIAGADPLDLASDDVGLEAANTSFQVHLRVDPADFTRIYNAVQLASAPALAVSGNSPTFLGHRLWEETRIAVFKQSVDDRPGHGPRRRPARTALGTGWVRGGALELFTESIRRHQPLLPVLGHRGPMTGGSGGQAPPLDELRLHRGTVWRWNRAIYDPACGGHLRIEMRALPAGPTMIDMLANAAFLIGLTLSLASQDQQWTYALPFERADHGFHRAAQHGLSARLSWPAGPRDQMRTLPAAKLVTELVPVARQGLLQAGVAAAEADGLLEVIAARAASGQTGAAWQRATLAATERRHNRQRALALMLDCYLHCADTGLPVHTWPIGTRPGRTPSQTGPSPGALPDQCSLPGGHARRLARGSAESAGQSRQAVGHHGRPSLGPEAFVPTAGPLPARAGEQHDRGGCLAGGADPGRPGRLPDRHGGACSSAIDHTDPASVSSPRCSTLRPA
jgi:gamma-glutamyl:cysteine ligase YbdK (ATP-grasp superfamily)